MLYTELKGELGWTRLGFHHNFSCAKDRVKDEVDRISSLDVTEEMFIERFERPNIPIVITDIQNKWNVTKKWTIEVPKNILESLGYHVAIMTCSGLLGSIETNILSVARTTMDIPLK